MLKISIARIVATVVFGWMFGVYVFHDHLKWNIAGRDAFLQFEAHRFDTSMLHPRGEAFEIVICVIVALGVAALYEVLVLVLEKVVGLVGRTKSV